MPEIYRVGNHQPQNLYRGDTYIGVMFDPDDAAMIVQMLNRTSIDVSTPAVFRDANGDLWEWDEAAGGYRYEGFGQPHDLSTVKETWGTYSGVPDAAFPQEFRDGTGIWWSKDGSGPSYLSPRGGSALTLAEIKEAYGSWDGWTDAS